jgi:hypothetical protein
MHGDFSTIFGQEIGNDVIHQELTESIMTAWHDNFVEERIKKREGENAKKFGIRMKSLGTIQRFKEASKKLQERRCLHMSCDTCHGTGKKPDGYPCIHMISCPCPICSPARMIAAKPSTVYHDEYGNEKTYFGVRNEKGVV